MGLFAIGDIHGCYKALKLVVAASEIRKGDTLVLVGDFISKGPDSRSVVEWIIQNRDRYELVLLRGNHEDMMIRSAAGDDHSDEWMRKGGKEVLESYDLKYKPGWEHKIPAEHWDVIRSTRRYWQHDKFLFVHAGVMPGLPLRDHDNYTLFWKKFRQPKEYAPGVVVIYGHTAMKDGKIADFGHSICLDTYAYGGKWLSCINLHTRDYWQASESGEINAGHLTNKVSASN